MQTCVQEQGGVLVILSGTSAVPCNVLTPSTEAKVYAFPPFSPVARSVSVTGSASTAHMQVSNPVVYTIYGISYRPLNGRSKVIVVAMGGQVIVVAMGGSKVIVVAVQSTIQCKVQYQCARVPSGWCSPLESARSSRFRGDILGC